MMKAGVDYVLCVQPYMTQERLFYLGSICWIKTKNRVAQGVSAFPGIQYGDLSYLAFEFGALK